VYGERSNLFSVAQNALNDAQELYEMGKEEADEETIESIKRLTKGNFRDTRNLLRKSQILSDLNDGIPINKELIEHAVQMMLLHNANY